MRVIKIFLLSLFTIAMLLTTSTVEADTNIEFNNFADFKKNDFQFDNEKGKMDVDYQNFRTSVSGGIVRQQAGRRTSDNAYGAGSTSFGHIVTTGSVVKGRARYAKNASNKYVWGGFWTLYDRTREKKQRYHYLEHDILETFPSGNFFNRYINKDYKTNKVFVDDGLRQINGTKYWRKNWREYQVKISRSQAVFKSGSTKRTVKTADRAFNERLVITNRPWGPSIFSVGKNSRIADLQVDYIRVDNP